MIYNSIDFLKNIKLISLSPYISNTNLKRTLLNNNLGQITLNDFLGEYHSNSFESPTVSKYKDNLYNAVFLLESFFINGLTENVFSKGVDYPAKKFLIENGYPPEKNILEKTLLNYSKDCDDETRYVCKLLLENNFYKWIHIYNYNLIASTKFTQIRDVKLELTNYLIDQEYDFEINKIDIAENSLNRTLKHLPITVLFKNRPELIIIDFLSKSHNFGIYNIKHLIAFDDDFLNFLKISKIEHFEIINKIFKLL